MAGNEFTIGLIGARGHTGKALLRLIANHPGLSLNFASSREFAGKPVATLAPDIDPDLMFEALSPEDIASREVDIVILALPDGASAPFVAAIDLNTPETTIIDLSADYRFSEHWVYGLPELLRLKGQAGKLIGAKRIANPGCYATAMQLAIAPLLEHLEGAPSVFGVSGYSGAGTTPSPKNDPKRLADNLMPYKLTAHNHEREASRHLETPVRFTPHVHPAFSGIVVTAHIPLQTSMTDNDLRKVYMDIYQNEPLIELSETIPELKQGTDNYGVIIGGFEIGMDSKHAVIVAAEDNLLKGAAVQAIQSINIALGFDELTAIPNYQNTNV